jgi:cullin 3
MTTTTTSGERRRRELHSEREQQQQQQQQQVMMAAKKPKRGGTLSAFSILPYKHSPPLKDGEREWEQLRSAIQCVFENATKHLSFEELSNVVYRMVLSGSSTTHFMREKLKEELRKRARTIKEELKRMETSSSFDGVSEYGRGIEEEEEEEAKALAFLEATIGKWSEFERQVEVIRDVFMHMERKKLDDVDAANSRSSYAGRGAPATTPAQRRENEKRKKKLGVRSLGREIFSQYMFGIPLKIDLDDEKYALETRKSTITAHLQACVKLLLERERRDMQKRVMEFVKAEEAENAPVSLVVDDENDDENIVDEDLERREAMVTTTSASARVMKSNDDEEFASTKRRNVIKLTAEMFWTLSARASESGYEDIYEDIIASKFVREAEEVYAKYASGIAESSRDCSQYLRRCKTLLRHEKYLVEDTMASKSNAAKRIIRAVQTAMFGIKSQAREHAFMKGFSALMIKDDMDMNSNDDFDLRLHEELVVIDGVTTTMPTPTKTAMMHQTPATGTANTGGYASTHVSNESRYADVRLAYDLFAKLTDEDGLDTLRAALYDRVEELGNAIVVANEKNPIDFVRETIRLKKKTDMVIRKGFRGDKTFTNRAYAAFEHFLNNNRRSSEFLSLYLDHYLRGNLSVEDMEVEEDQKKKTTTTQQIWKEAGKATIITTSDAAIDACIAIFRFLREKDTFEMYYQLHLSKRLLASKSVSDDHSERDVVSKLKLECGYQYAQKVEVMLNDASLSKAITRKFNELVEYSQPGGDYHTRERLITTDYVGKDTGNLHPDVIIGGRRMMDEERFFEVTRKTELNVKVLTTGSWPLTKLSKLNFPKNLPRTCQDMQKLFVNHYEANYGARRIAWRPDCGTAELKVQFNSGEKLLVVSTMQMCILEIFNDHTAVSLRQISKILDVEYDACIKAIHGMVFSEDKNVLIRNAKTSMSQTNNNDDEITSMEISEVGRISKDDIFMFNDNFESKHYRIKIATASTSKKETVEEAKRTAEIIHEDRKPEIEAAIVRILKAKRKVEHNALIAEVSVALRNRFKVDVSETKKRIERLIELEYVARDDKDRKIYRYLC